VIYVFSLDVGILMIILQLLYYLTNAMMYTIQDNLGNVFAEFETIEQAEAELAHYEQWDREEFESDPFQYEIA
jgi:hypothetical protein